MPLQFSRDETLVREGALILITEEWLLKIKGGQVTGTLEQWTHVTSTDDVNFHCVQKNSYSTKSSYTLVGTNQGGVYELDIKHALDRPSPCPPHRLPSSRVQISRGHDSFLVRQGPHRWTLTSATVSPQPEPTPSLRGTWTWTNKSEDEQTRKLEVETWIFNESGTQGPSGFISGSYERSVLTTNKENVPIPCAGSVEYRVVDHYTFFGRSSDRKLYLAEQHVKAEEHPCTGPKRNLDSAVGEIFHDTIRLRWRGNALQILTRGDR